MTGNLVLERSIENIEATYVAVGSQGEGAWIERWEGGFACFSRLQHPVSNFGIVRRISSGQAADLRHALRSRRAFNAYLMPGDEQEECRRHMTRHGFCAAGTLVMMVGEASATASERSSIMCAEDFEPRLQVARFMAQQFFGRQTANLREAIALATARSSLDLYWGTPPQMLSAAMVSRTPATFGIYNLCVDQVQRERGYGTELLASLMWLAANEERLCTLQCDPKLEPWYLRKGFQSVGSISVLALDRKASHAIM